MKITTLSTLLSVVSLGAVAVLALKVDELADEVKLSRSSRPQVSRDHPSDPGGFAYRETASRRGPSASTTEQPESGAVATRDAEDAGDEAPSGSLEERLAKLERDVKRQRSNPMPVIRGPRFARDLDDLSDHLKLTRSQRDRVQDSLRRARERIDAVMSVPGADGVSPKQAQQERQKKLQEALARPDKDHGQILQFAMGGRKLNEKVPGSNETYADQIQRIKKETREEVKSGLSADQQKAFEDTNIDGLVGGNTGTVMSFVTTATAGGPGSDGPAGAIVVDTVDEVAVEVGSEDE